ncbi:MAG: KH domain-containing protein [Thermoleophilia bacterium]|nr:KH domain-containing protein [Thermoleophilia bacterium]
MRTLLEYLARSLVERPDEVQVEEVKSGDRVTLRLRVAKEDLGRIIGKEGRVAKALRAVVKAGAVKSGQQARVEILD